MPPPLRLSHTSSHPGTPHYPSPLALSLPLLDPCCGPTPSPSRPSRQECQVQFSHHGTHLPFFTVNSPSFLSLSARGPTSSLVFITFFLSMPNCLGSRSCTTEWQNAHQSFPRDRSTKSCREWRTVGGKQSWLLLPESTQADAESPSCLSQCKQTADAELGDFAGWWRASGLYPHIPVIKQ